MSDLILYATLASSILVIIFILSLLRKNTPDSSQDESERQHNVPRREPVAPVRRVGGGRVVRSRLHRTRQPREVEEEAEEDEEEDVHEIEDESASSLVLPDGKIGAKKRKKLEMKAEKRAHREQELQEREDRKQRQAILEEQRKAEEEKQRLEEEKQKEEEQRLKEEKARHEHEEYLKLKEAFQIEDEGFDVDIAEEGQDLYKDFIHYIINEKVVQLEDLAVRFKLKTQEAIDRLNSILLAGDLTGVMDDRGKFIYISKEELEAVAKFIRQRGRVTISELAESSNLLINMNPKGPSVKCAV